MLNPVRPDLLGSCSIIANWDAFNHFVSFQIARVKTRETKHQFTARLQETEIFQCAREWNKLFVHWVSETFYVKGLGILLSEIFYINVWVHYCVMGIVSPAVNWTISIYMLGQQHGKLWVAGVLLWVWPEYNNIVS